LGQFDLSETTEVAKVAHSQTGAWTQTFASNGVVDVDAFWSNLDGPAGSLNEKDRSLLGGIFNPTISDRRSDGDCFVPPDASFSYVEGLRKLLQEEERVRQQRKQSFMSADFSADRPGPLFPSSWTSQIEVRGSAQGCMRQTRMDFAAQSGALAHALRTATATFDKTTEDGLRFRVYKLGSLEVRTTQELNGTEVVAPSSRSAAQWPPAVSRSALSRARTVSLASLATWSRGHSHTTTSYLRPPRVMQL